MSQFRTRFKTTTEAKIVAHYSLTPDAAGAERLDRLLTKSDFVYPGDVMVGPFTVVHS